MQQLETESEASDERIADERAAFVAAVKRIEFGERAPLPDSEAPAAEQPAPAAERLVTGASGQATGAGCRTTGATATATRSDIPITFRIGVRSLLAIEKGPAGQNAINELLLSNASG